MADSGALQIDQDRTVEPLEFLAVGVLALAGCARIKGKMYVARSAGNESSRRARNPERTRVPAN